MGILGFFRKKHKKASEKSAAKAPVVKNGKRVMLEIYDMFISNIMKYWLEKGGYEVLRPQNRAECLGIYRKHRPDVVIMTAGFDGVETLEELMRGYPRAQVIMCEHKDALNAEEMEMLVVKSIRLGAKDFLLLPVEPERLLRSVRSLCG